MPLCRLTSAVLFAGSALCMVHSPAQSPVQSKPDCGLKLNQIQVIGTHNSYHAGIAPGEAKLWQARNPDAYRLLDYQHRKLSEQLDAGVRQLELDVFADTAGGRYAHPSGPQQVAAAGFAADPPFDPNGLMSKPGFKVMHIQDLDYRSNCQPFTACLEEVRRWSHAHPDHVPVFILVETKEGKPRPGMGMTEPEPFTPAVFDALDAEIRSVFPASELVTPDDVRGRYSTLNEAVLAGNWPLLTATRGKVVFLMDQHAVGPVYLEGHASLRGRAIFTNSEPGRPDAAFLERNEGPVDEITALVRQGYLIRARTDADTRQARANDTAARDRTIASGAQLLSTDYPANEPAPFPGHFSVSLPGAREFQVDAVNAEAGCRVGSGFAGPKQAAARANEQAAARANADSLRE